jgi:excisionase family DNA binding protein
MEIEPVTVTVEEARKAIGCGRNLIYDMLADGRLCSITIGRRRFITTASIRRLVDTAEHV